MVGAGDEGGTCYIVSTTRCHQWVTWASFAEYPSITCGCRWTCAFSGQGEPSLELYWTPYWVRVEPVTRGGRGVRGERGAAPRHPRKKSWTLETRKGNKKLQGAGVEGETCRTVSTARCHQRVTWAHFAEYRLRVPVDLCIFLARVTLPGVKLD